MTNFIQFILQSVCKLYSDIDSNKHSALERCLHDKKTIFTFKILSKGISSSFSINRHASESYSVS